MDRLACISIDLDDLGQYARIHGLETAPDAEDPVYTRAAQRFGELLARHHARGTVFVIGEAVRAPAAAASVRALAESGHEIGNHSLTHDYRLSTLSRAQMDHEVRRGGEVIAEAVGVTPLGFRAPGYNVTEPLLETLVDAGYRYDSSVFPSAVYFGARAAVLAGMGLLGRRSASIRGRPEVMLAPSRPYRPRPDAFWRRGTGPLVELPISVVPGTGLPFIGTAITTLPWHAVLASWEVLSLRGFVNLELHGIDFLDVHDPVPEGLARHQPDLAVPAAEKLRRLDEVLHRLAWDHELVPLAEAAARVA